MPCNISISLETSIKIKQSFKFSDIEGGRVFHKNIN